MKELIIVQSMSDRSERSLGCYFTDLKKLQMISKEEEINLSRKIRSGDKTAMTRLVKSNLRFVISVAKQYQHLGVSLGDLINEGNIGLINAAKKFDETKGYRFISYAVWWIRQAIIFAIAEQARIVHIPYNMLTLKSKISKATIKLEQELGRLPSVREIADLIKVDVNKVTEAEFYDRKQVYIDSSLNGGSEATPLDVLQHSDLPPDTLAINSSLKQTLNDALKILSPRDQQIIQYYFGLSCCFPMSLDDIAVNIGLSIEHTRRLKDLALEKLRKSLYGKTLQVFL